MDLNKMALRIMVRVDDGLAFFAFASGSIQKVWERVFTFLHGLLARDSSDHLGAWIGKCWNLLWLPLFLFVSIGARFLQIVHERMCANAAFFQVVERPLAALLTFLSALYRSRTYQLKMSLSMVGFAVLLTGLIVRSFNPFDPAKISQRYTAEIDQAISDKHFDRVRVFQEKLNHLGVKNQQRQLQTIQTLADQGKMDEAIAWAERIAPLDQPGFAAAHYWLALYYLNDDSESALESANFAQRHLEHVVSQHCGPGNRSDLPAEIEYLQATASLKQNRVEQGLAQLDEISSGFWPAAVLSLELNQRLNREQGLIESAERLLSLSRKQPDLLIHLNSDCYALWSNALLRDQNSGNWKAVIDLWHEHYPNDQRGLRAWVPTQFKQLEAYLARGSESDLDRATVLLDEIGLGVGVEHRELLADWILDKLRAPENQGDAACAWDRIATRLIRNFDEEIASRSGVLREILGTAAILRGDESQGIVLLKQGLELEPKNSVAWNNLAYLTSKNSPEKIHDAFKAANRAVELDPQNVNIRLTRGMVAMATRQWSLAADDLQYVNQFRPGDGAVHRNLAIAFGQLGKREQETLHRLLAGE